MQRKKISIVRPLGRSKHKDSLGDSFLHIKENPCSERSKLLFTFDSVVYSPYQHLLGPALTEESRTADLFS